MAARLAKKDEALSKHSDDLDKVTREEQNAQTDFNSIVQETNTDGLVDGCISQEIIATKVYALFTTGTKASKTITAQYLAGALEDKKLTPDYWRTVLPPYLVKAIDYVTGTVDAKPQ
jgi:putative ATP-dependent endonuclease of OLD family